MLMKTSAYLALLLTGLALTACKPTPRTATEKHDATHQKTTQQASASSEAPATPTSPASPTKPVSPQQEQQPSSSPAQTPASTPTESTPEPAVLESIDTTLCLLEVAATHQDYNLVRPWEKDDISENRYMGVYLGDGKVLTYGDAAKAATYIELRLPDGSQPVPAKVIRYNRDLNLALLTVTHEADASLFANRKPLELGSALSIGAQAEFWGSVQGVAPARIPVTVESSDNGPDNMLSLTLKAAAPIPSGNNTRGLPIVQDGKLCALTSGYDQENLVFSAINAELIQRFLTLEHAEAPTLGLCFSKVDDPVFRRYLKLDDKQGGLYIWEVIPDSAAQAAGLQKGDVLTAIGDLPIDTQGRCRHPLYGTIEASAILRGLKPVGEHLTLTICRNGEQQTLNVSLNRDALDNHLIGQQQAGEPPRYIVYGGLLFQPLTAQYLETVMQAARGSLPLQFLELEDRDAELKAEGRKELVALTLVIPTPATLSYEDCSFCLVEKVNGKVCTDFAHFAELLDEPTESGLITLSLNKPPYTIALNRDLAETCNRALQAQAIPHLRSTAPSQAQQPAENAAGNAAPTLPSPAPGPATPTPAPAPSTPAPSAPEPSTPPSA